MKKIKTFFKEITAEWKAMKKPDALWKDTFITLVISVMAGGFFMGLDTVISLIYKLV